LLKSSTSREVANAEAQFKEGQYDAALATLDSDLVLRHDKDLVVLRQRIMEGKAEAEQGRRIAEAQRLVDNAAFADALKLLETCTNPSVGKHEVTLETLSTLMSCCRASAKGCCNWA
jgi:hypothetical protein